MKAKAKIEAHLAALKKKGRVKWVLEKIKEESPKVKWEEVTEEEGEHLYRMEGNLDGKLHLSCVAAAEEMTTDEAWFLMYRTMVLITGEGGYVQLGKHAAYAQALRVSRSHMISFTTAETMPDLPKCEPNEGTKLPGEDVEKIDEEYFFSDAFQREVLGFLVRMTLTHVPRDTEEKTLKEVTDMPSGSEMLHYHVERAEA